MDRDKLRELLRENVLEIAFRKADDTLRIMQASTNPIYIPNYDPEAPASTNTNEDVVRVIDTELGAWRSIRFDSIETVVIRSPAGGILRAG